MSGAFEYRIRGTRGTVTYLSFGCYSGSRPGQGSSRPDHLDSSRLVTQEDGSFEVRCAAVMCGVGRGQAGGGVLYAVWRLAPA